MGHCICKNVTLYTLHKAVGYCIWQMQQCTQGSAPVSPTGWNLTQARITPALSSKHSIIFCIQSAAQFNLMQCMELKNTLKGCQTQKQEKTQKNKQRTVPQVATVVNWEHRRSIALPPTARYSFHLQGWSNVLNSPKKTVALVNLSESTITPETWSSFHLSRFVIQCWLRWKLSFFLS